jgi:hypothetical protein
MKYILALIGAYLIVGPIYVRNKLAESSYLKIPPFIMQYQSEGGIGRLIAVARGWPVATFINREFGYWAFFAVVAALLIACKFP